jgi:DNA-binding winged helix-turn-helix (wHTH) protein
VRALTRRGMGATSSIIKHGPLVYDQAGRVATIDGKMVELSARELGLLEVLLQRAGRLVSKDQLVERLCEWGEEVSNNAIEVYIHRLRKKIEKGPIRIATVRGLGYCLEKIQIARLRGMPAQGSPVRDEDFPARAALAVRRNPRLDAHAAAAAVADQPGAHLAGGAEHRRQAVRPRARIQRAGAGAAGVVQDGQRVVFNLPQPAREILRADDSDQVYYQVLGGRGELLSGEKRLPAAARRAACRPARPGCATTRCAA